VRAPLAVFSTFFIAAGLAFADPGLTLTPSIGSSQPVGTSIKWTASASGSMWYQFSVQPSGGAFSIVRDFSSSPTFTWTPIDEGQYVIRVVAQATGSPSTTLTTTQGFAITTRALTGFPVVTATSNPLVALYSAPPCGTGTIVAQFAIATQSNWQSTNSKPCSATASSNFYIAGMLAATNYKMRHVVYNGSQATASAPVLFTTGAISQTLPTFQLPTPATQQSSLAERVVLHSILDVANVKVTLPVATDIFGRVIWYYNGMYGVPSALFYITRPVDGGTMLGLSSCCGGADYTLLEIDLAGNAVRQTMMSTINRQLAQLGYETVKGIHHEAVRFPNGQTLLIGMLEHTGPPDTLGDMIIALDPNFQVVWAWNSFDHMDQSRGPLLGETCAISYGALCPAQSLSAVDWLHSNSISYSPDDHNLIVSMRHQDWVVKIDYQDGQGSGNVIWRLGWQGDFTFAGIADLYPWFSHQHDVDWQPGSDLVTVFDNGNTRCAVTSSCMSRGQVWQLDEENHIATLQVNDYLGVYSDRHGSAQILSNGNYFFSADYVEPWVVANHVEITPSGSAVYDLVTLGSEYRTFRMKSLYQQ
jgi:hypothetical protein